MAGLGAYLQEVSRAYFAQKGDAFGQLLSFEKSQGVMACGEALRPGSRVDIVQMCERQLQNPIDEMMTSHCKAMTAYSQQNYLTAYDSLVTSTMAYLKIFKAAESPWVIEPLYVMIRDLRVMAELADVELKKQGKNTSKLSDAGSQLMRCFRESLAGAGHKAKKIVTLFIVNQLFKIYFKLNTLHLCKNLIKAVNSPQVLGFENFPVSQRVTYKFFVGRLSVFNDEYDQADVDLTYALKHCTKKNTKNKRAILLYLVPVRLLRGSLPKPALLTKHNLPNYIPLVQAMRTGNIRLLNETLQAEQEELIRTGTYIILEKLKASVYRTLFKKIHAIHKTTSAKPSQVPLGLIQTGLAAMGVVMDLDEVECVLVNLIYRKYIKGYISHKARVLVLSKQDAFPSLSAVFLSDPA